jgi:hypothetical protein
MRRLLCPCPSAVPATTRLEKPEAAIDIRNRDGGDSLFQLVAQRRTEVESACPSLLEAISGARRSGRALLQARLKD